MNDLSDPSRSAEPATPPAVHKPSFTGRTGELYAIFLRNLLLSILTLGIYRFWGKTRMRRFIWSRLLLQEEPFEYSGTGKELFLGFLKAAGLVVLMLIGFTALQIWAASYQSGFGKFVEWVQYVTFLALIYIGTFMALRYRLSRTRWRGIRFYQNGSAWSYGLTALRGFFFMGVTLGLYTPFLNVRLRAYQFHNLSFGTLPFAFDGKGSDLFKPFVIAWLLFIPTLGFSIFWYNAKAMTYYAAHTSLGPLSFAMPVRGWDVFSLAVGNMVLTVISLGLLTPVVTRRTINFWCERLSLSGQLDPALIHQAAATTDKSGEGLASFFDIDAGLA